MDGRHDAAGRRIDACRHFDRSVGSLTSRRRGRADRERLREQSGRHQQKRNEGNRSHAGEYIYGSMKRAAVLVALLAMIMFLMSGPGTRMDWFPFTIGLRLFALSLPIAVIALLLTLIAIGRDKQFTPLSILALGISTVLVIVPASKVIHAFHTAPIHDITTDPADPPPALHGGRAAARRRRTALPGSSAPIPTSLL